MTRAVRHCGRLLASIATMTGLANPAGAQIRVNPTGVNINAHGATTVFLMFGGLGTTYRPVEAFWCGELVPAAPDIGMKCDPATLFGRLPLRYDLSSLTAGSFTDIMAIPASVTRRAYDAAVAGATSSFFYVRRFAGAVGQPDQYVIVTCRMAGGGARVPLSLTDVRVSFATSATVPFVASHSIAPSLSAEITYSGSGRLRGRWEIVRPGDPPPESRDLLTEGTLPPQERGTQQRFEELSRFNVFLPPVGRAVLPGPDSTRLPVAGEGMYQILLRIEASDDKEGDADLGAVGAGSGVIHSGAVAAFPMPVLQYVVGESGGDPSTSGPIGSLRLLSPGVNASPDVGGTIVFAWSAPSDARWYRLEVETLAGVALLSAYVAGDTHTYRSPPWFSEQAGGKRLRWRVLAVDGTGRAIARTGWRPLGGGATR
jgi:hypothetical protein